MSATMTVDMREFSRTLDAYLVATSKTLSAAVNNKAGRVALAATNTTHKAKRQDIEALGVDGYRLIKNKKTGELRQGRPIYNLGGSMRNIIAAREVTSGRRDFSNMDARVKSAIARRLKSIGFLRAGWLPAFRALRSFIGGLAATPGATQQGKPKGYAKKARDGFNPLAVIANSAAPTPEAAKFVEQGLARAFREETADMKAYLERKLKETAARSGIETRG